MRRSSKPSLTLGVKLVHRVHRRIDFSSESFLGSPQRCHHIAERRVANHEQIDVTGGMKLPARGRAEHERCPDLAGERHQPVTEDVDESGGLGEQALQLRKDRRLPVGLKVPDTERRAALMARSRSLRTRANATMERLKDNGVRTMMKVSVLQPLDDIDGLFLGAPDARPSSPVNEEMWLNNADQVLSVAEHEYARLEALISAYGGPDHIRSIG